MAKIDRLGWAAGFTFEAYGVRAGVRVSDPQILPRLWERLPPNWKLAPSPTVERLYSLVVGGRGARAGVRRLNLLYGNAERLTRSAEVGDALERLEDELKLYVAEYARRRVFVHAGVVEWGGRAILIPGRSGSGKSTLVAELVRAGATYYSDEYAVLDGRGRVHPYPRRISLRGNHDPGSWQRVSVESLGGRAGTKPLHVGLVLVSGYAPECAWRPRKLSAGRGVLALLEHAVSARRRPEKVLGALRRVMDSAEAYKGTRGEAAEAAPLVLETLAVAGRARCAA